MPEKQKGVWMRGKAVCLENGRGRLLEGKVERVEEKSRVWKERRVPGRERSVVPGEKQRVWRRKRRVSGRIERKWFVHEKKEAPRGCPKLLLGADKDRAQRQSKTPCWTFGNIEAESPVVPQPDPHGQLQK